MSPEQHTTGGGADLHPALDTPLCRIAGIRYPIVQTGMGWVSGPELTAATSNAGGLGILAGATLSAAQLAAAIGVVRDRTPNPFGVNIRSDAADARERVDLLIREKVAVASFALAPRRELIERLKGAGVAVIPSVGALRHAEKVAAWGADAVIAQGSEGGGHTGQVPTSLLIPQLVDGVDIPVIAAGGFFDGRGLVAALAYGAAGIAMGTRFLLTSDSTIPDAVKNSYLAADVTGTVVTSALDGVPQRLLKTPALQALLSTSLRGQAARTLHSTLAFRRESRTSWPDLVRAGLQMKRETGRPWSSVMLAANTPMLIKTAMVDGLTDRGVMATGQVVGLIAQTPSCAELIADIIAEAHDVLTRLEGRPAQVAAGRG